MCGILGIFNLQNREAVSPLVLRTMADSMQHRGPDGAGEWIAADGQCALAHRRLAILDLSPAGHQPMATPDRKVWLTFNGEIYNFKHLRQQLLAKGHHFRSDSDTEVILYLYKEYGRRFHEYLDGDFALGLWDCERNELILARDRAGVKPLYYALVDGRFIFASEIKAILCYPGIDKSTDPTAFYHYLTYLMVPPPHTLIRGVCKLEAASTLELAPRRSALPRVEKYWLPLPNVDHSRPFGELDEELESLFRAAVKKRLASDVPVGVMFSGGVDSTLNLCAFNELIAPERVKTFTVGMDNASNFHDDSAIARAMASEIGSVHHEVRISEQDLLDTSRSLAKLQDEPISDPVVVPLYFVTKLAKDNGVTVLQAGEGADELFCGYGSYRRFMRHHDQLWKPLSRLPRAVSSLASRVLGASTHPKVRKIRDVLERRGRGQELFMSSAVAYYELEKQSILSADFKNAMGAVDSFDVVAPYYAKIDALRPDATFLQRLTFIELQLRLPELLLMRADKMAMANSVEIRVPFLDRDIIDFSLRVPDAYKLRGGISKEPIKRLATNYVARDKIYRPKTGFGVPIEHWFKGALGRDLRELISADRHSIGAMLDVKRLFSHDPRTVNEAFQLWVIYNFLNWKNSL